MESEYGRLENALYDNAIRFDTWSEQILDEFMCTKFACPCLSYTTSYGLNSEDAFKNELEKVERHDRTFVMEDTVEGGKNRTLMYFVKNGEGDKRAYKSMYECLHHKAWEDK